MEPPKYRRTLVEISKRLRPNELETMKFMLAEVIPKRRMEEIRSALQLFDAMEERELLGADNLQGLRQLLIDSSEGRTDLTSILDKAVNGPALPGPISPVLSPTQPTRDLSAEFEYLSKNLGRSWKTMCRYLMGIKEADFDDALERHPRNLQEQILYILQLWQKRNPSTASREALKNTCLQAHMRLHAENIEDRNFHII